MRHTATPYAWVMCALLLNPTTSEIDYTGERHVRATTQKKPIIGNEARTRSIRSMFMNGTNTWPATFDDVCLTVIGGARLSAIACVASENAPVIIANV